MVAYDKYVGPTPESNWVVPGKLLVGAYPASADDAETLDLITSILQNRVTKFVCLQQEYREHGVTEAMWRSGQALRPYFDDVRSIVKKKHLIPCLTGYDVVSEQRLCFTHFPIRDCSVTDDDRVLELARSLVRSIAEGHVLYLHCWGGHGRTGTLVCIMLHLMYGMSDREAMHYCQTVHDLRQCPVVVGSPQTQTQRDQVSRVIHALMSTDLLQRGSGLEPFQSGSSNNSSNSASQSLSQEEHVPSLPSPVARTGEQLQNKLGSPRSATKAPLPAAAAASISTPVVVEPVAAVPVPAGVSTQSVGGDNVAQCLTNMPPLSNSTTPAPSQQQEEEEEEASQDMQQPEEEELEQPEAEAASQHEDNGGNDDEEGTGRMRLGTMDETDMHEEEGEGGTNNSSNNSSSVVADMAMAERRSLEEGEMLEAAEETQPQPDVDVDVEVEVEEVRGAEEVAVTNLNEPNEPALAKPSFRPLWGGRKTAA